MEFLITVAIFVVVVVFTLLMQGKMMTPDASPPYESEGRPRDAMDNEGNLGEELVDWGSLEERLGDKRPKKRQRSYDKYKSRDAKRFQSYRENDEAAEEDDTAIIDELLEKHQGDMNRAMEELAERKHKTTKKLSRKAPKESIKENVPSSTHKYAQMLRQKQGLKDAVVLSEILNKKYN